MIGLTSFSAIAETLFYAPFDGSANAETAAGSKIARMYGKINYVNGIKGEAAVVGGKTDRIVFSAAKNFNIEQGTCSFWIQPQNWLPATKNFAFFVSFKAFHDNTNSDIITYKVCKTTNLAFLVRNRATKKSIPLTTDIALWQQKQWHNIVLTWDARTITFYLDGKKISSMAHFKLPEEWKEIIVGVPYPSWIMIEDEKTAVDELVILNECLEAEKVAALYKNTLNQFEKVKNKKDPSSKETALFHASFDRGIKPDKALNRQVNAYGKKVPIVPGIRKQAAEVAGKEKIKIYYKANENMHAKTGTCIFWVKPEWAAQEKNFYFLLSLFGPDTRCLLLKSYNAAKLSLILQNTRTQKTKVLSQSIADWKPGQWHQLALIWNKGSYRLFIDGAACGAVTLEGLDKWNYIVLGTALPSWGHVGLNKTIVDELAIFPEAFTTSDIKRNFDAVIAANPAMKAKLTRREKVKKFRQDNDLALAANGAWILASSFGNYHDYYSDNLIDNNPDTVWQPKENEYPQYLELRWKFPRKIDKIVFRSGSNIAIDAASVKSFDRINGKWKTIKQATAAELKDGTITFPCITCRQLRFVIEKAKDKVSLSELEAYGPPQPVVGKNSPYWNAWYIWYPEPDQLHKGSQPRYFRRVFNLTDSAFKSAFIQARSNDYYRIWVNGNEVATGSTMITPVNVGKYLKKGKNIIAVESDLRRNPGKWGWGELLVELSVNYPNGSLRIGTGPEWKSSNKKLEGWTGTEFDDAKWLGVYCYKRPPEGPWGKIAYHCTSIREKIKFAGVKITPEKPEPGSEITVSVTLKPEIPLGRNYFFAFELGHRALNPQNVDYIVSREIVNSVSTKGKVDAITITAKIPLPPWTPSGKIPLRLCGYDSENGIELDLDGIKDNVIAEIETAPRTVHASPVDTAKVAYPNGQAAFVINDQATTPFFWRHIYLTDPKRLYTMDKYSNIKIHQFLLYGGIIHEGQTSWPAKMAELERRITTLLGVDPDAGIIILADLRPSMQWLQANPDERLITAFGERDVVSFASKKYRRECRDFWKYMLDYLKKKPYWKRIVGFHVWSCGMPDSVMGGVSNNVWQADRGKITAGDYNPQALAMFRDFLRKKYKNDVSALRKSWKKPDITFAAATPDIKELVAEGKGGNIFRDPTEGRMTFDYAEFLPTILGGFLRELSRFVKEETDWKKMIFVHYGFLIAHMQGYNSPGAQLNNNNFDLPDMLEDPAIDGYIGAPSYGFRQAGTPMVTYFPWTSFRLHDRMYLPDDDNRTYVAAPVNYGRNRSQRETRAITRRNMGADITRNFGSWFSDMSQGSGRSGISWFGEKEVTEMIGEMDEVYSKAIRKGYQSAAEIAVIFSPETPKFQDVYYGPTLSCNLIKWMWYTEFFKLGAPFDVYVTSDLRNPKFPAKQYKMIVMMNTFFLSDADRKAVDALKADQRTILWFYAPGYVDWNKGLQTSGIKAMTGMNVAELPGKEQMQAKLSNTTHPLSKGLPLDRKFTAAGFSYPATKKMHPTEFGPRFRITDNKADIIAKFADGKGAIAARDFGNWKSVYSVVPRLDRSFLMNVCRWAGVHIYTDEEIVFDANRNFIILHNGYNGAKSIKLSLPRKTNIFDAISGKKLGNNTDQLKLTIEECSTSVLYLE